MRSLFIWISLNLFILNFEGAESVHQLGFLSLCYHFAFSGV
jgi:hypothetical protein